MERAVPPPADRATATRAAGDRADDPAAGPAVRGRLVRVPRVVVAVVGIAVLVWLTVPLEVDGVLHLRREAWLLVGAGALLTGVPGGLVEAALARWAHRSAAVVWLAVFGFFALWAPVLVSSRWAEGDGTRLPTSGLGVAVVGWLLALAVEYGVARGALALGSRASGTRAAAARSSA
ncbi:hypothetical protein [Cellulomonas sp. NS3]|uniref:hypothetical protein n=1 Tax=Cellulomonas sp. NS3 TaxID=2973977 RepID=UPI00216127D0|nr:hypothetical protein [Cellulomonas sp. NS3]